MHKLLTFILLLPAILSFAQMKVDFDTRSNYLGSVKPDHGPLETAFMFTNRGGAALQVSGVESPPSCKVLGTSRGMVKPGSRGFISLLFQPPSAPGRFMETVIVYFDGNMREKFELVITGEVLPREKTVLDDFPFQSGELRMKSATLDLGRFRNTEKVSREFHILNAGKVPLELHNDASRMHMDAWFSPQSIPPGKEATLNITYNAARKPAFGPVRDTLVLFSMIADQPPTLLFLDLYLDEDFTRLKPDQLEVAPEVSFTNTSHEFGAVKAGSEVSHTFSIRNKGKRQLMVREVVSSSPYLQYELENTRIRFQQSVELKVTYSAVDKPGPFMEKITLICNDPDRPEVNVYVQGAVVR